MKAGAKRHRRIPQRLPGSYLTADLSRDAGKLWVGGEYGQVFHGFNQRGCGNATAVPVFLREIAIQSLVKERRRTSKRIKMNLTKKREVTRPVPPYVGLGRRSEQPSCWWSEQNPTLMVLTRLAVLLATSLADWTKCLLAAGLVVLDDARRQALHRAEVCLATMVAAERTWATHRGGEIHSPVSRCEPVEHTRCHHGYERNTCTEVLPNIE